MKHALVSKLRQWLDRIETPAISQKEAVWDALIPFFSEVTGMPTEAPPAEVAEALVHQWHHLKARYADLRALLECGQPNCAELIFREYSVHQPLWGLLVQRGLLEPKHVSTPMGLHEVEVHLEDQTSSSFLSERCH